MKTPAQNELWKEFVNYTGKYKVSRYERKLLRDWVRSGHSVHETVESRYLPGPAYPPMDFIGAYRLDRELAKDMKGMNKAEKAAYLKAYIGFEDPTPEQAAEEEAKRSTPKIIEDRVRRLERELFYLWCFVCREGLETEASEYVEERKDDAIPFEW